jgi:heme A synthase
MKSPWLHRYSLLVVLIALFAVLSGAYLTTNLTGPPVSQGALSDHHHVAGAALLGFLTLGLAIWLMFTHQPAWLVRLGWIAVGGIVAEAALGEVKAFASLPKTPGIVHACLAQLVFSLLTCIAVFTSRSWIQGPEPVQDYGWPSMRSLAILTPVLVFCQVFLGAAYRHQAIGVVWHLLGAMFVSLIILVVCVFAQQQFPKHRTLRPAAVTLLSLTGAQVFLGLTVYTMRLETDQNTLPVMVAILAHIATGTATFAASVVLGVQIRRNVHPKGEAVAPAASGQAQQA